IVNNRSYRILKERLVASRRSDRFVAMDLRDPAIDFVGLAQGLGLSAVRVTEPARLAAVLKNAVASGKPNLVEVIVEDGFGSVNAA
ncbi:MAG TPA: thiamine pyrophosphate-dependent enzyme, partial [Ramlibacter sp.]|nr:thiamine pyrophosphate-dependent enzyme [Ramlibacter sp.]